MMAPATVRTTPGSRGRQRARAPRARPTRPMTVSSAPIRIHLGIRLVRVSRRPPYRSTGPADWLHTTRFRRCCRSLIAASRNPGIALRALNGTPPRPCEPGSVSRQAGDRAASPVLRPGIIRKDLFKKGGANAASRLRRDGLPRPARHRTGPADRQGGLRRRDLGLDPPRHRGPGRHRGDVLVHDGVYPGRLRRRRRRADPDRAGVDSGGGNARLSPAEPARHRPGQHGPAGGARGRDPARCGYRRRGP